MSSASHFLSGNVSGSHLADARLVADVGGTNARFAWQARPGDAITDVRILPTADYASLQDAMRAYLDGLGRGTPRSAAIAIANPVAGDRIHMTNHHWSFSQSTVKAEFGLHKLRVLNDFTALALALPDLTRQDLDQVGGTTEQANGAMGLVGAGTGLGVSGLLPDGRGGWVALEGEGGHVTLPASTPREQLVTEALAKQYGHASAERVNSGQGLLDTFKILCHADDASTEPVSDAADVTEAALNQSHPQAVEALNMFCALLGSVAGNLALTIGARGGVYIGGGIVPRLGAWFHTSPFRERFESKGRFKPYLQSIPVWVITSKQSPALLGAARALDESHAM